ncbi:unnamed protein product [Lactuca saligna]|uniref:Uncharacterized protein n=1 Tax=Lactuca saligna TaxID=75948 RepID=A0AA35VK91_LACSI|nr:unnamed protein product [Lactuca saligna]
MESSEDELELKGKGPLAATREGAISGDKGPLAVTSWREIICALSGDSQPLDWESIVGPIFGLRMVNVSTHLAATSPLKESSLMPYHRNKLYPLDYLQNQG